MTRFVRSTDCKVQRPESLIEDNTIKFKLSSLMITVCVNLGC